MVKSKGLYYVVVVLSGFWPKIMQVQRDGSYLVTWQNCPRGSYILVQQTVYPTEHIIVSNLYLPKCASFVKWLLRLPANLRASETGGAQPIQLFILPSGLVDKCMGMSACIRRNQGKTKCCNSGLVFRGKGYLFTSPKWVERWGKAHSHTWLYEQNLPFTHL